MSEDKSLIRKFDGEGWHRWKFQAKLLLDSKGCWEIVSGTSEKPELLADLSNKAAVDLWEVSEKKAKAIIATHLDDTQVEHVVNCSSSKEMWSRLESIYEMKSEASKMLLLSQFHQFK